MVQLPIRKTEVEKDLAKYTMFLYGREKIGKTTLAAQFPDALFLMCEPGARSLEIYRINVNNWVDFVDSIKLLKTSPKFKTIIIDTVDLAFKYCTDYVCKKLAIQHPSEGEWGMAYGMIRDEFVLQLSTLAKMGRGVIFLSHAQEAGIKKLKGEAYSISPTLSKSGRNVIEPMVDIWGYYGYEGTKRYLQIEGNEEVNAGCRLTQNFVGISTISMGSSSAEAYKNFIAAFNTTSKGGIVQPRKMVVKIRK